MDAIIKRVVGSKKKGVKTVYIPRKSEIQIGDHVKIIKVEKMEDDKEEIVD